MVESKDFFVSENDGRQEFDGGLASLSPGQAPCPGFKPEDWVETLTNARRFVNDFGAEADWLGWDILSLFSVHPKSDAIRGDWCGVLMSCLYPVREVTAEFLRVHLWRCMKDKPGRGRGVAVWEFGR
ncbi:MAG: hypothetical protein K2X71_06410 [Methylobacterium sp.]|uniref:hypothetical protein n=1 Tax=Methylobacterium sp. TaxID=409 RepID=UPI002585728B|nr:hypothetical protein [Methylobacterium sp.]MBY0295657.1 hypothetical protein [Methylobacterium sp.]